MSIKLQIERIHWIPSTVDQNTHTPRHYHCESSEHGGRNSRMAKTKATDMSKSRNLEFEYQTSQKHHWKLRQWAWPSEFWEKITVHQIPYLVKLLTQCVVTVVIFRHQSHHKFISQKLLDNATPKWSKPRKKDVGSRKRESQQRRKTKGMNKCPEWQWNEIIGKPGKSVQMWAWEKVIDELSSGMVKLIQCMIYLHFLRGELDNG